jgi:hypothetical protein
MKRTIPSLILCASLWAGTSLNCIDFATSTGSLFSAIKPLSETVQVSTTSPEARQFASDKLSALLKDADADPKNVEKQVKAGFMFEALRQNWGRQAAKFYGMSYLERAVELAPQNPEVHLIIALAYVPRDQDKAKLHRKRAQELAAKDSPTAKNLELSSRFFGD